MIFAKMRNKLIEAFSKRPSFEYGSICNSYFSFNNITHIARFIGDLLG